MGILMRHPDVSGVAEAVDDTQAELRALFGWVRLTDEEAEQAARDAVTAERAAIFDLPVVGAGPGARASDDLTGWTVAELHQLADARGVAVKAHDTKADLIAAIEAGPTPTET